MGRGRRLSAVAPRSCSAPAPRGGQEWVARCAGLHPPWSCVAATYEWCESPLDGIAEAGHLGACELGAGYRVCEAHAAAVCRRRPRMHGRKLACITRPSVLCGNAQDAHCAQLRLAQACRSLCRPPAAHSTRTFELHLMMPIVLQNPVWSDHGETACTRAKIVRYPCDTRAIPQAVPIAAWGPTKALRNLVLHWRCSGLLARGGKNGRHEFHTPPLHNTNTTP